jgi:hypothetical protein
MIFILICNEINLNLFNTKATTSSQRSSWHRLGKNFNVTWVRFDTMKDGIWFQKPTIFQRLWFSLLSYSGGSSKVLLISDIDHWGLCETCFVLWAVVIVSLFTTSFIIFVSNLVQCFLFNLHILATNWHFWILSVWFVTVLLNNFKKRRSLSFQSFSIASAIHSISISL